MPEGSIVIHWVSVYALSREKQEKRINRTWTLSRRDLEEPKYAALVDYLSSNLALNLNRRESELRAKERSQDAPYSIKTVDPRKEKGPAYLVGFKSGSNKREALIRLTSIHEKRAFENASREVAQWFADTQYWPKSYLFVATFEIVDSNVRLTLTGILTSELRYGSFVEDPSKIVDQLEQGIVGDVKKALICPHITAKTADSFRTDSKVKVYEENPQPAQYFYEFAGLKAPRDPVDAVGEIIGEVAVTHTTQPLQELIRALQESPAGGDLVKAVVALDGMLIEVPIAQLERHVRFVKLAEGRRGVLLVGQQVKCEMAGHDLFASGIAKFLTTGQLRELIEG